MLFTLEDEYVEWESELVCDDGYEVEMVFSPYISPTTQIGTIDIKTFVSRYDWDEYYANCDGDVPEYVDMDHVRKITTERSIRLINYLK